jgi:ABC-type lipoprotein export system ATPase subunit
VKNALVAKLLAEIVEFSGHGKSRLLFLIGFLNVLPSDSIRIDARRVAPRQAGRRQLTVCK